MNKNYSLPFKDLNFGFILPKLCYQYFLHFDCLRIWHNVLEFKWFETFDYIVICANDDLSSSND